MKYRIEIEPIRVDTYEEADRLGRALNDLGVEGTIALDNYDSRDLAFTLVDLHNEGHLTLVPDENGRWHLD